MGKKNGNVRKKAETRQLFTSPCKDDSGLTVIFTNKGTQQLTYLPLIMPAFHRIMNTRQVREYPDSIYHIQGTDRIKRVDHYDVK